MWRSWLLVIVVMVVLMLAEAVMAGLRADYARCKKEKVIWGRMQMCLEGWQMDVMPFAQNPRNYRVAQIWGGDLRIRMGKRVEMGWDVQKRGSQGSSRWC